MHHAIRHRIGPILIVVFGLLGAMPPQAHDAPNERWVASWATASKAKTLFDRPLPVLNDVTLRQIVRVSVGGSSVRVWLTNEAGTAPLHIGAATVGLRATESDIVPGSSRELRFAGASAIAIAPGARVLSDPVRLRVRDLSDLVISTYLPDDITGAGSPVTYHVRSLQTSYLANGNQTANESLAGAGTEASWFFLAGVDVLAPSTVSVIGALGDSITDGDQLAFPNEPVDLNARFTDYLAQRLLTSPRRGAPGRSAVINLGISGNQVTRSFLGDSAQARLDRDALTQTGITHLIVIEGINDIGLPGLLTAVGLPTPDVSAATIIFGLQQIVARAHARGLIVIGGTLSPSGGSSLPGYSGLVVEAKRQAVNTWIRTSRVFDVVVDFDMVLRDPAEPTLMRANLTADGLHPNSEGYRRMADAVIAAVVVAARND